jgi:hypothetical protein
MIITKLYISKYLYNKSTFLVNYNKSKNNAYPDQTNDNNEHKITACDGFPLFDLQRSSNLTLLSKLNISGYELSSKGNYFQHF